MNLKNVPKTIIITGINGQLAQFMVQYFIKNEPDLKIIGTIRNKSYDMQSLIFDRSKITIELMDLADAHSIESVVVKYKPDYFINTAAAAFVGDSWQIPALYFEVNTLAVLHQLEAIRKHSPHTRYFNAGTSEEFATIEKGILNELSPLLPRSPYGASKCAARHIVRVWRESYGLYAIQGWMFNFESELRGEKYVTRKIAKGVARILHAIKNNKQFEPIELGNLDSFRSWQHVEDVVDGIWKMLNQKAPKEFVLSAHDVHNIRDFVNKSFAVADIDGRWVGDKEKEVFTLQNHVSKENEVGPVLVKISPKFYRPSDVTYLHGDSTKIKTELGWSPKVSFDELVKRMVENDIKNFKPNT